MWNLIETLFLIACVVGCGTAPPAEMTVGQIVSTPSTQSTPTSSGSTTAPTSSPSSSPSPSPSSSSSSRVTLAVYQLSRSGTPNSSYPTITYTATGYCTTYQSKNYCWDDGMKNPVAGGYTYYYSYFSLGYLSNGTTLTVCGGSNPSSGGCATDVMASPKVIAGAILSNIGSPYSTKVSTVFNTGTSSNVTCDLSNGVLDCSTFQVDTNQTAIQ